jgi:AcrR family transcriptional regulator
MARSRKTAESPASTQDRILAAALEVFAERGFDGARMRDIASAPARTWGC